jgi:hypothetical protein
MILLMGVGAFMARTRSVILFAAWAISSREGGLACQAVMHERSRECGRGGGEHLCLRACMIGLAIWRISWSVNACPCILYVKAGISTARTTNNAILSGMARLRSIFACDDARSLHIWYIGSWLPSGDIHAQYAQRFRERLHFEYWALSEPFPSTIWSPLVRCLASGSYDRYTDFAGLTWMS